MPSLAAIAFPSTGHPDPILDWVIHDSVGRNTNKALIDQCCCLGQRLLTILPFRTPLVAFLNCLYS